MIKYLFFVSLLLGIYASSVFGEALNLKVFEDSEVIIQYEMPLEKVVSRVAETYPLIKSDLEKKLNFRVTFKPTILLIHSNSKFQRMIKGNDLITAFAVSGNNTIVINYSKMERTPFDLELTLKHELTHLLLHQYIQKDLLPKWLNEGVSQWTSEGISDIISFNGNKLLKQAVLTKNYLALKDISVHFPSSSNLFILSYEESRSIVEYIDSKFGTDKLLLILNKLHENNDIEAAIFISLSIDINELENEWHKYLQRKYTWFLYLANNLYWIIFFVGAIITVIGYLQLRKRIKTYPDEDEDELI
jgi:hypothetical protein